MDFIKKAIRGLATFFFVTLLFTTAVVAALVMTFNSPKKIEKSLQDSGVYKTFVSGALAEAKKSSQNKASSGKSDIPISDPGVIAAANKAFPPELLQNTTENLLDGTYNWLSGKTKVPAYSVDLTAAKKSFASNVGQVAKIHIADLPACTSAQLKTVNTNDIDPFNLPCRPPGINLNAEANKVTNQLANSKEFLGTTKFTADNFPKDENGKTFFEKAAAAPTIYKWVNYSPLLLALLAILAGMLAFFLNESKRQAARTLAIIATVVGSILLLISIGSIAAIHKAGQPGGQFTKIVEGSFQQTTIKAIESISRSINQTLLWFAIAYLILGIGGLVALKFTAPKEDKTNKPAEPVPPVDDRPNDTKPKSTPKPKPVQG